MADTDLFPGFKRHTINTRLCDISVTTGGDGPALLLLHGFPQCHVMWHAIAPALSEHFTLFAPDLPGYGDSGCPDNDPGNEAYSKRSMAAALIEAMEALGHTRFAVAGHDRGGRVGYRMALDAPDKVSRLAVLDIVPTHTMWEVLDIDHAMKIYHWLFLAQPHPLPEILIEAAPHAYQDLTMASWCKSKDLTAFDDRALRAYHEFFEQRERIHACCNDYRAGQTVDLAHDAADKTAGKRICCPTLVLWGDAGIPSHATGPLDVWRTWADDIQGKAIDAGHFLAEENPHATSAALLDFFKKT